MSYSINVDTGGTFTDVFVVGSDGVVSAKSDTTPHDLTVGVLEAIRRAAEKMEMTRPELLGRTDRVRFSTTIGNNTIVTRSGPRVGLLAGDEMIGRLDASYVSSLSDVVVEPIGEEESAAAVVAGAVRALLERGARIILIALCGGKGLEQRETRLREIIAQDYPRHFLGAVPVLCSHQVTLHQSEQLRVHTAILDAYLHPVMSRVLYKAEDLLRDEGSRHPLLVATGDAGTARVAKTTAIRTWGSGPAGAVAGAADLSQELSIADAVVADVGGTTTDIGVVRNGAWHLNHQPTIAGWKVSLPIVDLVSIPIGGGSIVQVVDGEVLVGPESAGALPGPASFGLGGRAATVTDALLHLSVFDPASFLGGQRHLFPELALEAIEKTALGSNHSVDETSLAIVDVAVQTIADRVLDELQARNVDPSATALLATGGGGGVFAYDIARRVGFDSIHVFPFTATFSAFGLSCLEVVHSYEFIAEEDLSTSDMVKVLSGLRERAERDLWGEGFDPAEMSCWIDSSSGELDHTRRFQVGGESEVAVAGQLLDSARTQEQLLYYKAAVARTHVAPGWRETGVVDASAMRKVLFVGGERVETLVYAWAELPAGATIEGPAIIERDDATVVVPPNTLGSIGLAGQVVLRER